MTTRKYSFINKSGEVYPAFGCGRLKSVLDVDTAGSQPVYELVKPDGVEGIYIVNGPNNVADDKPGVGLALIDAFLVLTNDGSSEGAPEFADVCGPTSGRWSATTVGTGLIASGNVANNVIPVISSLGGKVELTHAIIIEQCNPTCSTYRAQPVHRILDTVCDGEASGSGSGSGSGV